MKTCRNCESHEFAPENFTPYCDSCLPQRSLTARNATLRTALKLDYPDVENCYEFHVGELPHEAVRS